MSSVEAAETDEEGKGPFYYVERGAINDPKQYSKQEIRILVQSVLANSVNLSTLIGSGASLPAVPLMGTIFQKYRDSLKNVPGEPSKTGGKDPLDCKIEDYLGKIADDNEVPSSEDSDVDSSIHTTEIKDFKDIEGFLSWLDYRIKGGVDGAKDDITLYRNIVSFLLEEIRSGDAAEQINDSGKDNVDSVGNNYRKVIQGLGESRRIVNAQSSGHYDVINLFTTNYDLCHERALEASRYAYTDGFTNGIKSTFSMTEFHRRPADLENRFKDHLELVNPFFRLIKLHGSINWKSDKENSQIIRAQFSDNTDSKADLQDVLISPTSSKFALTQNEPYSDLFREFVNTLAVPNTVLFTAGFSFGDDHIAKLILDALARPDFTLYAFVSKPIISEANHNGLSAFYSKAKSPNAFFIYPCEDAEEAKKGNSPLLFSDFADFFAPTTFTQSKTEDTEMKLPED